MTSENDPVDPYEVVLADLRAKRDQLDQLIAALESFRAPVSTTGVFSLGITPRSPQPPADDAGNYLGMSIADAARKLLASKKRAMTNSEILSAIVAGGLVMNSVDPLNTVGSILTRRFNQVGDIVRVGRGVWGLKEWYPNRTFKKAQANGQPTSETEPSAPVTPPWQSDSADPE